MRITFKDNPIYAYQSNTYRVGFGEIQSILTTKDPTGYKISRNMVLKSFFLFNFAGLALLVVMPRDFI